MWGQLRQLIGLGMDPSQWLHVLVEWERSTLLCLNYTWSYLEVLVLREEVGQVDGLVCAPLRYHHHTADLLHLWVVRWTHSI